MLVDLPLVTESNPISSLESAGLQRVLMMLHASRKHSQDRPSLRIPKLIITFSIFLAGKGQTEVQVLRMGTRRKIFPLM